MDSSNARRIVLASIVGTSAIVIGSRAAKGQWPEPRQIVGAGFVFLVLGGLADVAPGVAVPGSILIVGTTAIALGPGVFDAVSGRVDPKRVPVAVGEGGGDALAGSATLANGPVAPGAGTVFDPVTTGTPGGKAVKGGCSTLGFNVSARPGLRVRTQYVAEVNSICSRFKVRVSSAYRTPAQQIATGSAAKNSDHMCGAACDFMGQPSNMNALAQWAIAQKRFAVVVWRGKAYLQSGAVTPWEDHYDHVHISFARCSGAKGCG